MDPTTIESASRELLEARAGRSMLPLLSARYPDLDEADAYRISRLNHVALCASGERAVGRKIGFTNRGIWDEYRVYQPIWAYMYASTVRALENQEGTVARAAFCQPRIEPEIMVRFARAPEAADPEAIAAALDWVAHGFEIVDSHSADWKFRVADTVADFGLHGALFIGAPRRAADIPNIVATLSALRLELHRDGAAVDRGSGSNVLDGPLQAIAHLMRVLAAQDRFPEIAAGEIITTGTLTAAWPVEPGQRWSTQLSGVDLPGATLSFT